jgi:molybdopterin/thiamine biosynthesis adenylyltransferase
MDCTDNFAAKFLINDACILANKPFSHCGVLGTSGQMLTVLPGKSCCYRCIFSAPPPFDKRLDPSQVGIVNALPGVMGTLQAIEAIKFLIGSHELLTDALLTFNAFTMEFRKVSLKRNPGCLVCCDNPTITSL